MAEKNTEAQSKCGFVCSSELEDLGFAGYTDAVRGSLVSTSGRSSQKFVYV